MALRIAQDFEYKDSDWWTWWVWIEGPDNELDQCAQVTYVLHPTFPSPVRTVTDRASKFKLETAGWGVFKIYATVAKKEGTEVKLEHDLVLEYPDGTATTA